MSPIIPQTVENENTPANTPPLPEHPRPDAPDGGKPLSWHKRRGYWYKKHNGEQINLGTDWHAAHKKWLRIEAGLKVARRRSSKAVTIQQVVNGFLTAKNEQHERGELSAGMMAMYRRHCEGFFKTMRGDGRIAVDSLERADFQRAIGPVKRTGKLTLITKYVISIRAMFAWAAGDGDMIDREPPYGGSFAKASKKDKRKAKAVRRAGGSDRVWRAEEVRALLAAADAEMKAAILLAVNGAMGAGDLAALKVAHIDRERMLIDFPRPKTSIDRFVPIWPETLAAIDGVMAVTAARLATAAQRTRRKVKRPDMAGHIFVTTLGWPVARDVAHRDKKGIDKISRYDYIGQRFTALCETAKIERAGRSFYNLRATFRSAAVGSPPEMVKLIMGHNMPGLDADYVRGMVHRLSVVTDHVRAWLWPKQTESQTAASSPAAPSKSE